MLNSAWLTHGTIWLALSLYTASEVTRGFRLRVENQRSTSARTVRILNTAGCAAFLAHVVCAFAFYHEWSHAAAYADTEQQTVALTGWRWGGGLYVNYAFALLWAGETAWSWSAPGRWLDRPAWITFSVRGVFLFMIFNGAVVFVPGPARWFGLLLCAVLVVSWWRGGRQSHSAMKQPGPHRAG